MKHLESYSFHILTHVLLFRRVHTGSPGAWICEGGGWIGLLDWPIQVIKGILSPTNNIILFPSLSLSSLRVWEVGLTGGGGGIIRGLG
jgi:hypothetical protein